MKEQLSGNAGLPFGAAPWLDRIIGNLSKRGLQHHNHLILSFAVLFHADGQFNRVAAAGGQLKLLVGEPAILVTVASKTIAPPPPYVLGNLEACVPDKLDGMVVCLQQVHGVNTVKMKRDGANLVAKSAPPIISLSVHGQTIDPNAAQERSNNSSNPGKDCWPVLYYEIHGVLAVFGFLFGWATYDWWRAMRSNVES